MKTSKERQRKYLKRLQDQGYVQVNVRVDPADREWFQARAADSRAGLDLTMAPDDSRAATKPETTSNLPTADAPVDLPTAPRACPGQRVVAVLIPDRDDCQGEIERHARMLIQDKAVRRKR